MKVENWKRGMYREHERRIKTRSYLSLCPRFCNLALPNIWFPKTTKATVKDTVKCPLFSSCVVPLSPSYILSTHSSLSLSLSLSNQVYLLKHFLFPKAIQISINPKKENNILEYIYIYIFLHCNVLGNSNFLSFYLLIVY